MAAAMAISISAATIISDARAKPDSELRREPAGNMGLFLKKFFLNNAFNFDISIRASKTVIALPQDALVIRILFRRGGIQTRASFTS